MEDYLAHSARNGYSAQTYADHIDAVNKLVIHFAEEIGRYSSTNISQIKNILCLAEEYHDLGKLMKENQEVLHKEGSHRAPLPINHVDAGVAYLKGKNLEALYSIILIYSHHHGLCDCVMEAGRTEEACYRDQHQQTRDYVDQKLEKLCQIHSQLVSRQVEHLPETCMGDKAVFMRMLFSCLVDADHSDTARVYGHPLELANVSKLQPEERLKKLNEYVETLSKVDLSDRNQLRTQMYIECRDNQPKEGIVLNDCPVGSGKTTAIMAHLLQQAVERKARRIFVILPYTSIITQSVEVYRDALTLKGEDREAIVAELHHKADFDSEDTRYLTSLWRAPIIVTTAVAFFETLASNRSSTLRRLHELPGSVIFVDEAHASLPLKLLPLAWHWMKILEKEWFCYWVLGSGSLVRFWQIPELVGNEKKEVPKMVSSSLHRKLFDFEKDRVRFGWRQQPQSREELIDWVMSEQGPRILVVNTVQSASVIANDIAKKYGRESVEHLSTALKPTDRKNTVETVKKRLADKTDTNWVLVATSCVEAGMDFSFRVGFRELASVLSLLQIAGRVDREALYGGAWVWSFSLQDDRMLTRNPDIKVSASLLEEYFQDGIEITPELCTESIKDEMHRGRSKAKEIQSLLEDEICLNFKSVNDQFHVIENDTVPAIVDSDVADQVRKGKGNWRDVQMHSVSIHYKNLDRWKVERIAKDAYQWTLPYDSFLGYMEGVINGQKV